MQEKLMDQNDKHNSFLYMLWGNKKKGNRRFYLSGF